MQIQANMKMAEIVHLNYHLLQIISRFGIKLGFGDKTIRQVCQDYNINVDFFLELVRTYHFPNYFPEKHLQQFPAGMIVDYLRKSHHYYVKVKVPEIAFLLNRLEATHNAVPSESLKLIDRFFDGYKNELEHHILHEEEKVYPYVFEIEAAFFSKMPGKEIVGQIKNYSIGQYESEHDNVEDKLLDLKNLLIKYITVPAESDLCQTILFELFRLERDLRDHARLEDKILVPKIRGMEKWILDHYKS
jgi:regulator of cell morphogenesis and NO signaling